MQIPLFHVNAFSEAPCSGNPAAVCLLDSWLDDDSLRKVAAENALSATAFLAKGEGGYQVRWFTAKCEIRLCGHATLASGYVVLNWLHPDLEWANFETRYGGIVSVSKSGNLLLMNFPAQHPLPCAKVPAQLSRALNLQDSPVEVWEGNQSLIAVLENEQAVRRIRPDFAVLEQLHPWVAMVTAPGLDADFVSRYFAPSYGIPEDPVTGSAHCALTPYWTKRLGKSQLHARQLSARGGELWCEMAGDRVLLKGRTSLILKGTLNF